LIDPEGQYVERYFFGGEGRFGEGVVFGKDDSLPLKSLENVTMNDDLRFFPSRCLYQRKSAHIAVQFRTEAEVFAPV